MFQESWNSVFKVPDSQQPPTRAWHLCEMTYMLPAQLILFTKKKRKRCSRNGSTWFALSIGLYNLRAFPWCVHLMF